MQPHTTEPPTRAPARLVRSRDDRVVAGVCGGLGRYLGIDPVLLRLVAVVLVLFGGTGILAYIIAWIVIPEASASAPVPRDPSDGAAGRSAHGTSGGAEVHQPFAARRSATLLGVALIVVGALLLADRLIPGLSWRFTGPIVLVAIGVLVLMKGGTR